MKIDWQPIETAPKDRPITVWPPTWSGYVTCAIWCENRYGRGRACGSYWRRFDAWTITQSRDCPPTHWAPIPEGPGSAE